jgi:antitoxin component of RelBE/YafQ-DinJ toxin-antitoxin module
MNTSTVSKTDFIKFNVSPAFKAKAAKKAREHGMSLSELGRMLFGAFITDIMTPTASPKLLKMAEQAKKEYEQGKTKHFNNAEDAIKYLHSL